MLDYKVFILDMYNYLDKGINMDIFELAEKLYKVGYEHKDVRSIWAYAWDEQHVGQSGKKRKPWQLKALEEVSVEIEDIEFESNHTSHSFRVT